MDNLFEVAKDSIDKARFIAVLIGETDLDQRHVGIWHCEESVEAAVLHLAWHCRLKNDPCFPTYFCFWVYPKYPVLRLRQLASYCRRVWRKHEAGGIPFAFSQPYQMFDPVTGALLLGPAHFGLTCASFVLAVFDVVGLPLIDFTTWNAQREGDRQWQQQIIEKLRQHAEEAHIQHLESEIGSVRFRPEEVVAATMLAPPAAVFETTVPVGEQIVARIRSYAAAANPTGS